MELYRKLHLVMGIYAATHGSGLNILHSSLGTKENSVIICAAHSVHGAIRQSQLCRTLAPRLYLQWSGTIDGSVEMYRVSQSLLKPPAHPLAHPCLQFLLAKHLQVYRWETMSLGCLKEAGWNIDSGRIARALKAALGLNANPVTTYLAVGKMFDLLLSFGIML